MIVRRILIRGGDAAVKDDGSTGSDYLGAMLGDERRLVIVPLDPEQPWAAFRRIRARMRSVKLEREEVGGAEIIPFRPKDRDASR